MSDIILGDKIKEGLEYEEAAKYLKIISDLRKCTMDVRDCLIFPLAQLDKYDLTGSLKEEGTGEFMREIVDDALRLTWCLRDNKVAVIGAVNGKIEEVELNNGNSNLPTKYYDRHDWRVLINWLAFRLIRIYDDMREFYEEWNDHRKGDIFYSVHQLISGGADKITIDFIKRKFTRFLSETLSYDNDLKRWSIDSWLIIDKTFRLYERYCSSEWMDTDTLINKNTKNWR